MFSGVLERSSGGMGRTSSPEPIGGAPVLISLCGHSPAVVTETVWALAHESPPVLPDRIVVVTTRSGAERLRQELFHSGVWDRLRSILAPNAPDRLRFGDTGDAVRVIPNLSRTQELDDIRVADDSRATADFLLDVLRQFTSDPRSQVVLSVAGGRKTMSVLAALALTLVGRPRDRMCHVLVSPPFDDPRLEPRFYFPEPTIPEYRLRTPTGVEQVIEASQVSITLADIPYVRVRYLFHEKFGRLPGGLCETVEDALKESQRLAPTVTLQLDPSNRTCRINGVEVHLSALEFCLLWFFADRTRRDAEPVRGLKPLYSAVLEFLEQASAAFPGSPAREAYNRLTHNEDPSAIRKTVHNLAQRLHRLGLSDTAVRRLSPSRPDQRGVYGLRLRPEEIEIKAES